MVALARVITVHTGTIPLRGAQYPVAPSPKAQKSSREATDSASSQRLGPDGVGVGNAS